MAQKKIFISHSAHRDPSARPALDAIEAKLKTLAKDYSILLDHSTLRPGEDWRSTINLWCGGCDAAILLITPDAIDADYCKYEWSILSYRKQMSEHFHILPVYFNAKPEDLRGKPYQISEIQGIEKSVRYSGLKGAWPSIEKWLRTVSPAKDKPSTMQAYLIANLLRNAVRDQNYRILDSALEEIDLQLGTWEPLEDRWEQFAFLLLGLGLQKAGPALAQLYPWFDATREKWRDVLDLVACSWVDHRSAEVFKARSRGDTALRTVGLNAEHGETARLYVVKASDRPPSGAWAAADVSGVVADLDGLENQIAVSLAAVLGLQTSPVDRVRLGRKLQNLEGISQPVVVYLGTKGLNQTWLTELRLRFPSVTFFLLSGSDQPALAGVEWLEPELDVDFETRFWDEYENSKDALIR